jgi:hypothetical protein
MRSGYSDNKILGERYMIETLFTKMSEWSVERAIAFHGDTELHNDYIWEWSDDGDGVYLIQPAAGFYMDNRAGRVYILHTRYSPDDYRIASALSVISDDMVRFETPIERSSEIRDEKVWSYTVYERPNKELGYPFIETFDTIDNIENGLLQYIEFTKKTIEVYLHLGINFPLNGMTVEQVNIDTIGMFWINLKNFDLSYSEFIIKNMYEFNRTIKHLSRISNRDLSNYLIIAEQAWSK